MGKNKRFVTRYARMWPRTVFDLLFDKDIQKAVKAQLQGPGVYVLYRDDEPHYIGKTDVPLCNRIYAHANMTGDKIYNFWNFFSAFEVPQKSHRDELEAALIAAMPTANSARPRIPPNPLPREVKRFLAKERKHYAKSVMSRL